MGISRGSPRNDGEARETGWVATGLRKGRVEQLIVLEGDLNLCHALFFLLDNLDVTRWLEHFLPQAKIPAWKFDRRKAELQESRKVIWLIHCCIPNPRIIHRRSNPAQWFSPTDSVFVWRGRSFPVFQGQYFGWWGLHAVWIISPWVIKFLHLFLFFSSNKSLGGTYFVHTLELSMCEYTGEKIHRCALAWSLWSHRL